MAPAGKLVTAARRGVPTLSLSPVRRVGQAWVEVSRARRVTLERVDNGLLTT